MRLLPLVPAAACTLLAAGCPAHIARPYAAPTAQQLIAAIQARDSAVRSLRARTKMDHFDRQQGQRVKGEVLVLIQLPDLLHFHAVSPMGTPLATLTSDGEHFALFDADKRRFLYGPAAPCNIGRLTGVAMDGASVATILTGGIPLIPYDKSDESWDDRKGREVLTLTGADGSVERVELGGPDNAWNVASATLTDPKGGVVLTVENEHFHDVSGVALPGKTKITEPSQQADLIIDWEAQEVNPLLPARAFAQEPPEGVTAELVTCDTEVPASGPAATAPASEPASMP